MSTAEDKEPPTREELMARAQELLARTKELQAKYEQRLKPKGPPVFVRVLLIFGPPIALAVAAFIYVAWWAAVLAFIVGFILNFKILERVLPGPKGIGIGSRAWEAQMNLKLLGDMIAARRGELARADDASRGRLEREIAHLEGQIPVEQAHLLANDGTPGRGYVGVEPYPGD
jgi:hypothetical protein